MRSTLLGGLNAKILGGGLRSEIDCPGELRD